MDRGVLSLLLCMRRAGPAFSPSLCLSIPASQMLMFSAYLAVVVALYLVPLTISSPCIMEKKALGPKPAILGHRGAPMVSSDACPVLCLGKGAAGPGSKQWVQQIQIWAGLEPWVQWHPCCLRQKQRGNSCLAQAALCHRILLAAGFHRIVDSFPSSSLRYPNIATIYLRCLCFFRLLKSFGLRCLCRWNQEAFALLHPFFTY